MADSRQSKTAASPSPSRPQSSSNNSVPGAPNRVSFAKLREPLEVPGLLDVQTDSFEWLIGSPRWRESAAERGDVNPVGGLEEVLYELSPIEDFSGSMSLSFSDPRFDDVKAPVDECKDKDMTYAAPLFVTAEFINNNTGEIKSQTVFMGDFPMMTEKGTFIINGTERVVVSQLVRSPGVYFDETIDKSTDKTLHSVKVIPSRGAWLEFDVDKRDTVGVRIDRKRRQPVTVLLKALGWTSEQIVERFGFSEIMRSTLEKDNTVGTDEALLDIYRKLRPGEPPTKESAQTLLENLFFKEKRYDLARVGRYKVNKKLGLHVGEPITSSTLTEEDVVATIEYLVRLHEGQTTMTVPGGVEVPVETDDIDHFGNRRLRTVGELIQNQIRVGMLRMERVVRERMTTQDVEAITPQTLINIRPVVAAIKEFFGTSQLSQFMDQNNPLSGLTHKRRLSALGPGGLSRERAGLEVRDVHPSHYGRMCPIETPEGPNIGLIGSLSVYARVNPFGFIETPYRKVVDGVVSDEIVYLTADEEDRHVVAQANSPIDADGRFVEPRVLVRRKAGEVEYVPSSEVDYMDVSPRQMVSVATAMIPFLEHDDANRALMGANMQRQAVPLVRSEAPLVGTGMELRAAIDAGDVVVADESGVIEEVSADYITVMHDNGTRRTYRMRKFARSNHGTCANQCPIVDAGDRVEAGQVIADGPCTDDGEMALGKNLLVAIMPWEGHNYEDAIILSNRLVEEDVLTSIHIEEHEIDARDTKLGAEEITRDIPNISDEVLADLDERGIVRIGAEVRDGDILVGKVTPKGETELTPEERLLRAIFGEKAREVRDTSLKVPHGESGKVIGIRVFSREDEDELPAGVNELVRVYVAQKRKISDGDKLAGRHGNKGVIGKILPVEDMPFLADGTPVDIILNTHGVPRRMNIGQILETHLGWCAHSGWKVDAAKGVPDWAARLPDELLEAQPNAIVSTPVFDGAQEAELQGLLSCTLPNRDGDVLVDADGKAMLFDGRSGEPFPYPVTVGYMYIMKLHHLVDDKIHARSTGPYSMITQQPLGGKAQFGGQRFGEMECWAMQAYGAAYTLQELLTIKSDDTVGRVKVYEAIVKGENIPEPGIPESFKVLLKELQSLCLNVEVLSSDGAAIELREGEDEDLERAAANLGINLSRNESASVEDLA
ncbi:DNA-directed RNA polymerase RpoB [Mycobacterium tuberculosis variant africanum MAL010102]|uniref:DNA-directed RNA polymerase subunit beta n=2 Tax=Mycobacterium tuberculosis variant africanum TaxID=33894 RepID=A0A9P2H5T3_MYCTX|nr:DNA-directed RNA polymerase subunit beta [Mycobacterium tuberculosis]EFD42281.1 DNA-directed RNA polymerase subunit beta rpoB [Mycobacterium tuberculosis variant africanum K85]KBF49723.1 DNA-directed RNA polymerase RpoB [Mycobacterium tuberculosis variant africanum K85]KBG10134.1 DNA-directed RNA polymerase RpoB [Mycobacterium tuberculosis variant africanum MAL010070]KBG18229.1 DNA-directed RNA polymerase RpoB [Mycobacterium tuberculosis variant africanum MAL010071]KBG53901.1 DNA-directed R